MKTFESMLHGISVRMKFVSALSDPWRRGAKKTDATNPSNIIKQNDNIYDKYHKKYDKYHKNYDIYWDSWLATWKARG